MTATRTLLATTAMDSPVGKLTLVASDRGLRLVLWPGEVDGKGRSASVLDAIDDDTNPVLVGAVSQLTAYFEGTRISFDLPLDLVGTDFQVDCWLALGTIPYGETRSYAEQAALVGRPTATRAVGAANGRNPVPIVLPCHRVIGADGSLTGFGGGIDSKRWLLDHERARKEPALPFG
jgi:methylated-DNA-[protein]-cysteine S-methyltransferase